MESATTAGDRRSSIEPPRSSAQIEAEIGRLKRQTTRVVSPEHQRYRALFRESLLMEIARLEREKAHALRLEDQRRGALLRRYLAGRHAPAIRAVLRRIVDARDRHLFGL
jgi:hypothetical protein